MEHLLELSAFMRFKGCWQVIELDLSLHSLYLIVKVRLNLV